MAATFDAILRIGAQVRGAGEVKALGASLQGLNNHASKLGSLASSLTGLGVALGAGLGVAGLAAAGKGLIEYADHMDELAQRTGISVEMLARFGKAAKMSGIDTEDVSAGLVKLSKNLGNIAIGGGKDAAAALQAMGISATDASGKLKNADQVMLEVANRFADMPDGALKAKLAMDLFGKAGAALIPMLDMGGTKLENLKTSMTSAFAKNAGLYDDNLKALKGSLTGLGIVIMDAMLPSLLKITQVTGVAVTSLTGWFKANKEGIFGFIKGFAGMLEAAAPFVGGIVAVRGAIMTYQVVLKSAAATTALFNAVMAASPVTLIALAVAFGVGAVAMANIVKKMKEASAAAQQNGASANEWTASLNAAQLSTEDILKSLKEQNGEGEKTSEIAKQRAVYEKQIAAIINEQAFAFTKINGDLAAVSELRQRQLSLSQETLSAEQAWLGVAKQQLQNRLDLSTNEQERYGLRLQIIDLDRKAAQAQYQASMAQIEAEKEKLRLQTLQIENRFREAALAVETARAYGTLTTKMLETKEAARQAMMSQGLEYVYGSRALDAKASGARAGLALANVTAGGQQQQALAQLKTAQGEENLGPPRYFIETPNGRIAKYAKGGYIKQPTLAMVGEGGEPEYVVPSSKAAGFAVNVLSGKSGEAAVSGWEFRPYGLLEAAQQAIVKRMQDRFGNSGPAAEAAAKNSILRDYGYIPGAGSNPTTLRSGMSPSMYRRKTANGYEYSSFPSTSSSSSSGFKGQKVEVRQNLRIDKVERTTNGDMVTLAQAQELASKASTDAVNQLIQKLQQPGFRQQIGIR